MIERSYVDAFGEEHVVPAATVEALREAMGEPADDGPLIVHPGETPAVGPAEVTLEDGTELRVERRLPPDLPLGYHHLVEDRRQRRLIVSPGRCYLPEGRTWGWASQLYASRSSTSWGIGDLSDLRILGERAARQGAGMMLVNPLLAVPPTYPQHASPYYPASRRFLNPIYLRVEEVPQAGAASETLDRAAAAGQALNARLSIDRDRVWRLKSEVLETIWRAAPPEEEFETWRRGQEDLEEFAAWCVLAERHGTDWRRWPGAASRPATAVPLVRHEHGDRWRYHQWLQWLCRRQLDAASAPLMLMQDLPIGVDPGGMDAWAWQDLMALDVTVGAPPDEFNTLGQDWGLPPFIPHRLRQTGYEPFARTIRANLLTGGGMRIDHVMGLFRLFCIPAGAPPSDGAYVRFPSADLLDIVALESVRAEAVVVGEDLGTVEEGVREELADRQMLSYRLLWFEPDDPGAWPELAMASVTTHDLPTVAGLWTGSDLQEQRDLDLAPNEKSTGQIRAQVADLTGLDDAADLEKVVIEVHRGLAEAPSRLLCATLDDLAVTEKRPNIPGADENRPNWSIALPSPVEELMASPLAEELATIFNRAMDQPRTST